ncbi:hypothetical protein [Novilysobacter erysipheiresistens]|uniref:Uncharacterized protein n=1 Tax=Novilysobacter erysipheiresistens TaxID=1749332 RepID=A0ABU7YU98_9GAMM
MALSLVLDMDMDPPVGRQNASTKRVFLFDSISCVILSRRPGGDNPRRRLHCAAAARAVMGWPNLLAGVGLSIFQVIDREEPTLEEVRFPL